jgi:hypothetical protein
MRPLVLAVACLVARPAFAQIDQVTTPPPNLVLNNYNSAPVGPYGGLEAGAYVARVDDPSAAWFNPAGLARQSSAQISGSAGVYQRTLASPEALPNQGGSVEQLPNFVGFTFAPREGLTVGAALLTSNSWNQETDAELLNTIPAGRQRFAYSADSTFEQRELAISAGYRISDRWRAGAGIAFALMDVRLVESASDRVASATDLQTLLVAARASGTAFLLRSQFGAQYDASTYRLGAAIRTPGVPFHRTGVVTLDGTLDAGTTSLGASVFDPDGHVEYHLPWELQVGAAITRHRFEAEIDLQAYTPIDAYSLVSTDQPVQVYSGTTGQTPTVSSRPFSGLIAQSDGVTNISAGGHFSVFENRDLRVHAGVASNGSPVGPEDTVFNRVDLTCWSVGISGAIGKLQYTAGLTKQTGHADDVMIRNLVSGDVVRTRVDVSLTGFVYSLAYRF